jgi:outer membrane protein
VRPIAIILLSSVGWALGGCAASNSPWFYGDSVLSPVAWSGLDTSSSGVPATRPELDGPLTLERAIAVALAQNPDVASRAAEAEQARAARAGAAGAAWPALHAVGAYSHYLDDQRVVPARFNGEPGAFSDNILAGDLVLSVPLFTGGQIHNRIRAAELLEAAAEHRLSRTKEELVFNVASIYYAILGQRNVIESLEFSRTTLEEHRARIQRLIDAQKAVKVDLLRTEVRLANLQQRLVQEKNTLSVELRLLANLMGLGPEAADLPELSGELPTDVPQADAQIDLNTAYRQRADYLAAQAEVDAQARRVEAVKGARWPQVYGRASYGGRYGLDADRPDGVDRSDDVGAAGIVVDVPIFEAGQIAARIHEERMRLVAASERLRKLLLQVGLDVQTAVLNINSGRERIRATSKSIEQAKESYEIERLKYDQGRGAIVDVLDAQSALLEAQTAYYRALADYQTAQAQLRLAQGEHP